MNIPSLQLTSEAIKPHQKERSLNIEKSKNKSKFDWHGQSVCSRLTNRPMIRDRKTSLKIRY